MPYKQNASKHANDWVVSSPKRTTLMGLSELFDSRQVLYALVKRDFKSRYRTSFFGFAWALVKPLAQLVVYALVIGQVLGANRGIEYYALYLFTGLLIWGFISESLIMGTNSIILASGLVTKIQFPREILPLSSVVIAFVNMLIQIPVLILGYLYFDKWPKISNLAPLGTVLLVAFFISFGLALLLSTANVYARDTQPLVELVLMLAMYLSPIIYSWTFVYEQFKSSAYSNFLDVYFYNPLTIVVIKFQDSLWPGTRYLSNSEQVSSSLIYDLNPIFILLVLSIVFCLFSYRVFLKFEANFAREL